MDSNTPTEIDHTLAVVGGNTTRAEVGLEATGLFQQVSHDLSRLGRRIAIFLKNVGRTMLCMPGIIHVDRPTKFDLAAFVGGENWTVSEGETDTNAAAMDLLDLSVVRFKTMLKFGEAPITGEERLARAKRSKYARLDVGMFAAVRAHRHQLSKRWKEEEHYIYFDGTVILSPHKERFVFCMYWHDGQWYDTLDWLGRVCEESVSALTLTR